jgi:hypothetical protein
LTLCLFLVFVGISVMYGFDFNMTGNLEQVSTGSL